MMKCDDYAWKQRKKEIEEERYEEFVCFACGKSRPHTSRTMHVEVLDGETMRKDSDPRPSDEVVEGPHYGFQRIGRCCARELRENGVCIY
jgi:hypothetical protein